MPDGPGQFYTVHSAGHVDISKDDANILASFEDGDGFVGIRGFNSSISSIFY